MPDELNEQEMVEQLKQMATNLNTLILQMARQNLEVEFETETDWFSRDVRIVQVKLKVRKVIGSLA